MLSKPASSLRATAWLPVTWLLWAAFLLCSYYERILRLIAGDRSVLREVQSDGLFSTWPLLLLPLCGLLLLVLTIGAHATSPVWKDLRARATGGSRTGAVILAGLLAGFSLWIFVLPLVRPSYPAINEAAMRALFALLGAGGILAAAQVPGEILLHGFRLQAEDRYVYIVFRTGAGFGILSLLLLALACCGMYTPTAVLIVLGAILAAGGVRWIALRRRSSEARIGFTSATCDPPGDAWGPAWKAISFLACLAAFIGALAPEIEYDALWYHLWLPRVWLAAGGPVDIVHEYISLYPLNWELLFGAGMAAGGPVAAKLLHFSCLPLTAMIVHRFTRRFFPGVSPWLAAALFLTAPTVLWEGTTAYLDLALAFQTSLVLYATFEFMETRKRSWLLLASLNIGFALGTKHLALFVLAVVGLVLVWRLWPHYRKPAPLFRDLLLLALPALLLAAPWYIRSAVASGNPVFPDLYGIFGAFPAGRWSRLTEEGLQQFKAHFGTPRTFWNLLMLPWDMTVHASRYGGTFGPLFLLLVPGLLIRRVTHAGTLVFLCAAYLVLWASPFSSFQARFLVPIIPCLAVLAAAGMHGLQESMSNRIRIIPSILLFPLLLLNFPPLLSLHESDRREWAGWLTHVTRALPLPVVIGKEPEEEYLARTVRTFAAWRAVDRTLPRDARLLTFGGGDHFYATRERVLSDATVAHEAVWGAGRDDRRRALERMRTLGITHILFDRDELERGALDGLALAQPALFRELYVRVYEDRWYLLYRIAREDPSRIGRSHP